MLALYIIAGALLVIQYISFIVFRANDDYQNRQSFRRCVFPFGLYYHFFCLLYDEFHSEYLSLPEAPQVEAKKLEKIQKKAEKEKAKEAKQLERMRNRKKKLVV